LINIVTYCYTIVTKLGGNQLFGKIKKLKLFLPENAITVRKYFMSETAIFPFIDRTYEDALELLTETRNFVACQQLSSNDNGDIFANFFITSETSRLVSHLINVMTWLMWHKAANNGEITTGEAQEKGKEHLEKDLYAKRQDVFDIDLPNVLEKLIGRSHLLHDRVSRLSQMVH